MPEHQKLQKDKSKITEIAVGRCNDLSWAAPAFASAAFASSAALASSPLKDGMLKERF